MTPANPSPAWLAAGVVVTPDQFSALSQLLRLRDGPAREAARLVLVDGVKQADAARQAGVSPSALGNTLRACRKGLELARVAARCERLGASGPGPAARSRVCPRK